MHNYICCNENVINLRNKNKHHLLISDINPQSGFPIVWVIGHIKMYC